MMSWIDWMIVLVPLIAIAIIAFRTQKHVTSVAEFMAGGRWMSSAPAKLNSD